MPDVQTLLDRNTARHLASELAAERVRLFSRAIGLGRDQLAQQIGRCITEVKALRDAFRSLSTGIDCGYECTIDSQRLGDEGARAIAFALAASNCTALRWDSVVPGLDGAAC